MLWELFAQFVKPCLSLVESSESSPVDEEERSRVNEKWMTVSIFHSLRREVTYLLTSSMRSVVCVSQNDIVVS